MARIHPIFVDMNDPISSHFKPSGMLSRHYWDEEESLVLMHGAD